MPDLIAKPALGLGPVTLAGVTLAEGPVLTLTSIAPFPGQEAAVSAALAPLGLGFPAPNTWVSGTGARIFWTGRDQAFLAEAEAPAGLAGIAALTDQSDGWAGLVLSGPLAAEALMRLVPLDLRASAFAVGACVRAPLNHMPMILARTAEAEFLILVFRSMARSAWHEIETALKGLAARAGV